MDGNLAVTTGDGDPLELVGVCSNLLDPGMELVVWQLLELSLECSLECLLCFLELMAHSPN